MSKDKTQILLENHDVYEETLNEFSSKSYELASVNEIIKRSKYNKGSFYYRFKDKFELYTSLIDYVFVQQIDLYKKTGFSLITNDDSEAILYSMFNNLMDLYRLDNRYYHLILTFLNENEDFIEKTLSASVGGLYQRYMSKIKKIGVFSKAQLVVIESLYKNFPVQKVLNHHLSVEDLVHSLVGSKNIEDNKSQDYSLKKVLKESLTYPINYLLIDNIKHPLDELYYHIFDHTQDQKALINKLKRKTFSLRFNIRKILTKYMKKPIFDHVAVNQLLKHGLDKIKDDPLLMSILYALVYGILELEEFIVINRIIHRLDNNQLDDLMNIILPINGQLSKIIITERQLTYSIDYPFNNLYYYDEISGIKKYHVNDLKTKYNYKLVCEYVDGNNYQKKVFNDLDELIDFRDKNQVNIETIKHLTKLSLNDLRGDVT